MKTYKNMQESKTQDGTKPDAKITKKQGERGFSRALDPEGHRTLRVSDHELEQNLARASAKTLDRARSRALDQMPSLFNTRSCVRPSQ